LTVFSSRDLAGLFHPTGTLGVSSPIGQRAQPVRARRLAGHKLHSVCTSKLVRAVCSVRPLLHPRPHSWRRLFPTPLAAEHRGAPPKGRSLHLRQPDAGSPKLPSANSKPPKRSAPAIGGVPKPTPRQAEARPRNTDHQPATLPSSIDAKSPKRLRHRLYWHTSLLHFGEPKSSRKAWRTRQGTYASLRPSGATEVTLEGLGVAGPTSMR
jgi:hypothetical protein